MPFDEKKPIHIKERRITPGSFGLPAKRKSSFEIQQMAFLCSTAVLHFICSTRLLAERTPSVGFHYNISKIGPWCYKVDSDNQSSKTFFYLKIRRGALSSNRMRSTIHNLTSYRKVHKHTCEYLDF